ncbi:hypothetical protein [Amycolatopsis eburnea]|uniref:Uncharacterized protein n=1 Tax=Amycolatopsis eburnea TaxID=2267691 RepID=A0A3R9EZH6_9PSEU|nr:hypothetical protein [Amycolatopsis eburnea]RSD09207.1 hypothetical protein EIY87_39805 [Amycolatopsis eburnea]
MTGPGSQEDYASALSLVLDDFEAALVDRWQQTIHDCVVSGDAIPPALHIYKQSHYTPVYEHRQPEVYAHATSGNCAVLSWYEGGREGGVPTSCAGLIWSGEGGAQSVVWPPSADGTSVPVPETIDCGLPLLMAQAEEWSYQDRAYVYERLPKFADQQIPVLRNARDALMGMAADFGATASEGGEQSDPALQTSLTLAEEVDWLFGRQGEGAHWQKDWTGTAADLAAEGFFASTGPTLNNHALMANGLGLLINERATIIDTYRKNNVNLISAAVTALGATTSTTSEHDLAGLWTQVSRIGTIVGWFPLRDSVNRAITIVSWLGDLLLGDVTTTEITYDNDPGKVAIDLHESVLAMAGTLNTAEDGYADDVAAFRAAVNDVPGTFLELYDLTENSPTGTH